MRPTVEAPEHIVRPDDASSMHVAQGGEMPSPLVILLRHRNILLGASLAGFVLAAVLALLTPREYTAGASFITKARSPSTNLAGLAMQFGVALPSGEASQSPAFYADLLRTREILSRVAGASYAVGGLPARPLAQVWEVDDANPARRLDEVMRRLNLAMGTNVAQKTGVVGLSVTTRDPSLSYQIEQQLLAELDRYNLERRQSQAAAERRFAERRLAEVREELRSAEGQLQAFLQQNRRYEDSPELTFRRDRLAREMSLREQMFSALSEAYEQAKLEEVRDTPVITLVDRPAVPARPDSRGVAKKALLGLMLGAALGICVMLVQELRRARHSAEQRIGGATA